MKFELWILDFVWPPLMVGAGADALVPVLDSTGSSGDEAVPAPIRLKALLDFGLPRPGLYLIESAARYEKRVGF